jgi:hypothetical protein
MYAYLIGGVTPLQQCIFLQGLLAYHYAMEPYITTKAVISVLLVLEYMLLIVASLLVGAG